MATTPTSDLIAKAHAYETAGFWLSAVEAWAEIAAADPTSYHFVRYSMALCGAGQLSDAETAARRAVALDADWANPHFQLGFVQDDLGRPREAVDSIERGLAFHELSPMLAIAGTLWRRLRDWPRAEQRLRRAVDLDPDNDEAHFQLGLLLRELPGRLDAAIAHMRDALRLDPSLPAAGRELGLTLLLARRVREAEDAFVRAIAVDPDDAWTHFWMGQTLWALDELPAAREAYERAAILDPQEGAFVVGLADVVERLGDRDQANSLFLKALALDTGYALAHRQYGLFLERSGYLTRATRYLERALSDDPDDERVQLALERIRASHHDGVRPAPAPPAPAQV